MTILFETGAPVAPATHVLVIGVGHYRHLLKGSGLVGAGPPAEKPLGLKQLSSPSVSAQKVAEWFLTPHMAGAPGFENAVCPLGSIDVLISAHQPVTINTPTGPKAVEPALRQSIQAAFDTWLARLTADAGSVGVLYFCGHGLSDGKDDYLLAEDFGASKNQPWNNAFDISSTFLAIEREVKGSVYFLVDACRDVSKTWRATLAGNPVALVPIDTGKDVVCRSKSRISAVGVGRKAFAPENDVSRFTDALLTALSGCCGVKRPGQATWNVDGQILAAAILEILAHGNKTAKASQFSAQDISGEQIPLVRSSTIPQVKVDVDLTPAAMQAVANFSLRSATHGNFDHDGSKGAFRTSAPRGMYELHAFPKNAQFATVVMSQEELVPPIYTHTITAAP